LIKKVFTESVSCIRLIWTVENFLALSVCDSFWSLALWLCYCWCYYGF